MKEVLINHNKGQRPEIKLTIRRVEASVWYSLGFHKHHYLVEEINPSCKCFLFEWNDQPVAFAALLNTPRRGVAYGMSISRIVVLPDFQGLGLSRQICNFCGGIIKSMATEEHGYELYIKLAHEKLGEALNRDVANWEGTSFDGKTRNPKAFDTERYANRLTRKPYCKKYIGKRINGYEDLLLPIKDMRENKKHN